MSHFFDYIVIGVLYGFMAIGFITVLFLFYFISVRVKNVFEQFEKLRKQALKNREI